MVLVGAPQQVLVTFNPPALRRDDADVLNQLNAGAGGRRPSSSSNSRQQQQAAAAPRSRDAQPLTNNQIQEQLNQFLVAGGALVRINDAGRDHGQIRHSAVPVSRRKPTTTWRRRRPRS